MGQAEGYGFVIMSVLFFGSNFVVTKKYKTGDGFFFQWIMCSAILIVGLSHYIYLCNWTDDDLGNKSCPPFEPYAMLGGLIWSLGNILAVPVIQCIGLGLGMCLWGGSNMLIGWASANFGVLGVSKNEVERPTLNYVGVALAVVALVTFLFIKSEGGSPKYARLPAVDDDVAVVGIGYGTKTRPMMAASSLNTAKEEEDDGASWVDKLSPGMKKVVGIAGALLSGLFYGTNFNPPSYAQAHNSYPLHEQQMKNLYSFAFPHFCGIFVSATAYMLIYSAVMRNQPKLYPDIILPGFLSGIIWGIAQIGFFYANTNLGMVISFPMITVGPGLVGSLWGTFVFREVKGVRNYILLGVAFAFAISAAICIAMSNQ